MRVVTSYILGILLIIGIGGFAQRLSIVNTDSVSVFKKLNYKKIFNSPIEIDRELNNKVLALINEGYLTASIDSVKKDSSNYTAFLQIGSKYQWASIKANQQDLSTISKLGYGERFFTKRPFKYNELSTF